MTKKSRFAQRLQSFSQALDRLEKGLEQDAWGELEKDGVIQRFEFTFELAWKTLQDYFEEQGYTNIRGPKAVLQQAFQDNLVQDGELWIELLNDRNLMTHTYDKQSSDNVFQNIKERHFQALCDLYAALKPRQTK